MCAKTETLRESMDVAVYSSSVLGRRDRGRVSEFWIGSWSLRSAESELDSSTSSDSSEKSAERTLGVVVSVEGDGRGRCLLSGGCHSLELVTERCGPAARHPGPVAPR